MSSNGSEVDETTVKSEYLSDVRARLFLLSRFPTRPPSYAEVHDIYTEIKASALEGDFDFDPEALLKVCDERSKTLSVAQREKSLESGGDQLPSDDDGSAYSSDMDMLSDSDGVKVAVSDEEVQSETADDDAMEVDDSEIVKSQEETPEQVPEETPDETPAEPEDEEPAQEESLVEVSETPVEEDDEAVGSKEPVEQKVEETEASQSEAEVANIEESASVDAKPDTPSIEEAPKETTDEPAKEASVEKSDEPAVARQVTASVSPLTKSAEVTAKEPAPKEGEKSETPDEQPKSLAKLMRIETMKQLEAQNAEQLKLSQAALDIQLKNRDLTVDEANPTSISPENVGDSFLAYIVPDRLPEPPQYRRPLAELYYSVKTMPTWKLLPSSHKVLSTDIYKLSLLEGRLAIAYGRIEELRQSGKWSLFQRAKFRPPPREEVHQDYLLDEMRWMSSSFSEGRKYKIAMCKQIADSILEYWRLGPEECCIKARAPEVMPPLEDTETVDPADVMAVDEVPSEPKEKSFASLIPLAGDSVAYPLIVRPDDLNKVSKQLYDDLHERPVLQQSRYTNDFDTLSITSVTRFLTAPDYARGWRRVALERPTKLPAVLATAGVENGRLALPRSSKTPLFPGAQTAMLMDHEVRAPKPPDVRYMNTRNATVWTPSDDQRLLIVAKEQKYNWEIVSAYLCSKPTMGYTSNIERRSPWQCFERWLQLNKAFDVRDLKGRYAEQARIWLETLPKAQTAAKRRLSALGVPSDNLPRGHKRLRWSSMFEGVRKARKKKETSVTKPNPGRRQAALESLKNNSTGEKYKVRSAAELLQLKYERDRQVAEAYAKTRANAQQNAARAATAAPGTPGAAAASSSQMPVPAPTGPTAPNQAGAIGRLPAGVTDAEKARIVAQQTALMQAQQRAQAAASNSPQPLQRPLSAQAGTTGGTVQQRPQSAGATIGNAMGSPTIDQLKAFGNVPPSIAGLPLPASVAAAAARRAQAHAQAQAQAQAQAHAHAQAQAQAQQAQQAQNQARAQAIRNATPEQQQQMLAERRRMIQMAAAQRQAQQAQAQAQAQNQGVPPRSPHSSHGGSPFQSPVMDYAAVPQSSPNSQSMMPPQRSGLNAASAAAAAARGMPGQQAGSPQAANAQMMGMQPQRVKMSDYVTKTQFQQLLMQIHRQNPSWTRQQVQLFASQQVQRYIRREQEQKRLEALQAQAQGQGDPRQNQGQQPPF